MDNQQASLKTIPSFPDYLISNDGRIKSTLRNIWIKTKKNRDGYIVAGLRREGRSYTCQVHRLVALAFIENPYNLPVIHHINDRKDDNRVSNLVWCTYSDNIRWDYELKGLSRKNATRSKKSINQWSGTRDRVKAQVLELSKQGLGCVKISRIVNISHVTVWKIVKEASTISRKT